MGQKLALLTLTVASPAILVAFVVEHELSLWIVSTLTMAFPIALTLLGIARRPRRRALTPALLMLLLVLQAAGIGMLSTSRDPEKLTPWLFGLPAVSVFMLVGLWLTPLFIVSWAYPRTFSDAVLDREDLERVRGFKS